MYIKINKTVPLPRVCSKGGGAMVPTFVIGGCGCGCVIGGHGCGCVIGEHGPWAWSHHWWAWAWLCHSWVWVWLCHSWAWVWWWFASMPICRPAPFVVHPYSSSIPHLPFVPIPHPSPIPHLSPICPLSWSWFVITSMFRLIIVPHSWLPRHQHL